MLTDRIKAVAIVGLIVLAGLAGGALAKDKLVSKTSGAQLPFVSGADLAGAASMVCVQNPTHGYYLGLVPRSQIVASPGGGAPTLVTEVGQSPAEGVPLGAGWQILAASDPDCRRVKQPQTSAGFWQWIRATLSLPEGSISAPGAR